MKLEFCLDFWFDIHYFLAQRLKLVKVVIIHPKK